MANVPFLYPRNVISEYLFSFCFILNMNSTALVPETAFSLSNCRPMLRLPSSVMKCILSHVKSIHLKINSGKLDDYATVYNFFDLALCSRTFNCSASQKYLRYSRIVPMEVSLKLLYHTSCLVLISFLLFHFIDI